MDRNRDAGDCTATKTVALRKESVDRNNLHCVEEVSGDTVALRKESVDRNPSSFTDPINLSDVALRKESVDRNRNSQYSYFLYYGSLSARRAWIEIALVVSACNFSSVALRKESVDRNHRACCSVRLLASVALRKESVDRNAKKSSCCGAVRRRSPQGERG